MVVIDTSVFVSSLIGPSGPSRDVIRQCLQSRYQPLMGNALFCEYESVITRDHIRQQCPLTQSEILELLKAFLSICKWVDVFYLWSPNLRDEADNHLIELAISGNAQAIVTHNIKDFVGCDLSFPQLSILKPEVLIRS